MHISLKLNLVLNGSRTSDIDPVLFRLLNAIQRGGSLKHGAAASGISYRHAWGLIKKWEQEFHLPIVKFERGRGKGAKLTLFGEKLIWAGRYSGEEMGSRLDTVTEELNNSLAEYIHPGKHSRILMHASHGMAVMHLYELIKEDPRFNIEFHVHGSIDSLQNLYNGHCQIAGFHLPLQLVAEILAPRYIQWISPAQHLLLKLAVRQQGIIVKHGNPKNIMSLKDLTRRSIRFINRQRNSGTRTILDQLLVRDGIDSKKINGYSNEEFTHVAVGAMVASGFADAGFGIKAAAEQFKLDFIPYLQEAYILALDKSLPSPLIKTIKNQLQSRKFRQKVNNLAGYDARNSGTELAIQQLLQDNT
jgi:putative molybdopterin biosynthesis protein